MKARRLGVLLALCGCLALPASAAKGGSPKGTKKTSSSQGTQSHTARNKSTAPRASGRIKRSAAAKHQFEVQTGYPHGRPGYVVDHILPLACGGANAPANMQGQSLAEAKAKGQD